MVEIVPFRGAYVRAFSADEARNIDLTFAALLALAARQAAQRISVGDAKARLTAALDEVRVFEPSRGAYVYARARERFYRLIIEISGNEQVARICPIVPSHIVRMQSGRVFEIGEHRARINRYEAIHKAILAGDAAGAEAAVWTSIVELSAAPGGRASLAGHTSDAPTRI